MRTIAEIRLELNQRAGLVLADENRDSRLFVRLCDELAEHIEELEKDKSPK